MKELKEMKEMNNWFSFLLMLIIRQEGIRGFYKGFMVSTARTIPQSAYTFAVMNFLLDKFPLYL